MTELAERFIAGRKGSQISGVLLTAAGIFLFVSLVSHTSFDPPNSSQSVNGTINWAGQVGAHVSYGLFTAVGLSAYALPLLALLWGWNRLRRRDVRPDALRTAGLVGVAAFLSIASGLPTWSTYTTFELGGWLGTWTTSSVLVPYTGRVGSTILLSSLLLASILLVTDLDPRRLLQLLARIGHHLATGFSRAVTAVRSVQLPSWWRPGEPDDSEPEEDDEDDSTETTLPVERLPTISMDEEIGAEPAPVAAAPVVRPMSKQPAPKANGNGASRKHDDDAGKAKPRKKGGRYKVPVFTLLDPVPNDRGEMDREALLENARILEEALANFDVMGKVVEVSPGPVVTRYEVEPGAGVKVGRIAALADDLARVMSAQGIRIQAPVPGKSVVGVEIANQHRETVYLREVIDSPVFKKAESVITMALGKTISGENHVTDLAKMPHLLVAGATGAGKSVCINGLICSILLRATPDQVRLLMVDPKVVELTMYNDIPHLLVPVITEPKRASEALKWAVAEMESRYQSLARMAVRNLADYNAKVEKVIAEREAAGDAGAETDDAAAGEELRPLPFIVIVIDEFADLMLTAPADVETSLMGLAQKSRAVGIHIILATQRPSVNVITGVIKANFPSRIAFQVASKIDSRTILDMNGAERLLGRGDMLFLPGGQGEPIRIHGAFISGEETERLVEKIKESGYEAEDVEVFAERGDAGGEASDRDELFEEAVAIVLDSKQASTSFLQRRMKVGYSRAARLMDELEFAGIVGPAEGAKPREILVESGVSAYAEEEDLT
ncbi:MAG TPA: DNA translocase FtsK 4TM domain-containing protein [Candidatus Latescibacteria bacterium]|jgi:S-DNA-T family DNA segregation ATPase FtsK/SpoIIIE|nr:cell division protein FtsK [Gemmatimonadaceae bacterium]MDP7632451.1 DNA translocase FtsK 4TM domain-containing protein [Candidatus Latescibacterota bacterium]HJP32344.1 DNA translocase FtsK 4TM domain-containing protein [Candidatus Latescibacterota bacterium]